MTELPRRKRLRLPAYDYSQCGAYFVTICAKDKKHLFSACVGRGLAPAVPHTTVSLKPIGRIAESELLALEERFSCVKIDKYVIMPNHIHVVLFMSEETAGASPRPTLPDVVCAFKSLTVRACRKNINFADSIWQTGFYDHVIRNEADYRRAWKYIDENPDKWCEDEYFKEE